jgi:hypothetical protein
MQGLEVFKSANIGNNSNIFCGTAINEIVQKLPIYIGFRVECPHLEKPVSSGTNFYVVNLLVSVLKCNFSL